MKLTTLGSWLAAAALAACNGDGVTTARFDVPRGGVLAEDSDFFGLPFPNDFWRVDGGAGGLDLSLYPRPSAIIEDYLEVIPQRLDGFGLNAALFARFDGEIDPASLPATPEAAMGPDASVYLVQLTGAPGTFHPLRFRFEPRAGESIDEHWLSALPYPGFPLAEGQTYALVVTRRVLGADGGAVEASADWLAVSGAEAPADPDLARARAAAEPLLAWLDDAASTDDRDDVVSAAVFTTQSATGIMAKLRARVRELPVPVVRDVVNNGTGEDYTSYDGVFDAPNFQTGEVPYSREGGEIVLDEADGLPVVQRTEALRVSFTIPVGEMPAEGWPVAIYAHGTGGSYHSFQGDGTATRLARQGIAVISIDQVLHGPRNPGESPEISFFNFQNPLAARDNAIQGAADDFSVVRLVEGFEYVDTTGPGPAVTIRFDPTRMYFFGHSQGGLTGPPFVAFEPEIDGAVLSGAGGLIYLSMLHKTEPLDITTIINAIIRDEPLDEFNPTLALVQTWIERSDPVNYGPLLARTPPLGPDGAPMAPKHIFQSEGLIDDYTPPISIEALATSIGGNPVAPVLQDIPGLTLRGREVLSAPVTGNVDGTTVVLLQYEESAGSDGHFVVFDVPAAETQSAEFLGTLAQTGTATLVDP
jgi:hypothetical protein